MFVNKDWCKLDNELCLVENESYNCESTLRKEVTLKGFIYLRAISKEE